MKTLLVVPGFNPQDRINFQNPPYSVPLALATVSALTPDDVELDIWDETVRGEIDNTTDFKKEYDVVGVTGYGSHVRRQRKLGQIFRQRGTTIVVGGAGVSAAPEQYRDYFDVLFIGEAEYTWPRFISDWKAGSHRSEYRQVAKVDMLDSPLPRWDGMANDIGHVGSVQTTRGCPFDCEFCDVIYIYGRKARHKSISQVLDEVSVMERLGVRKIFFCDDNFYGNPRYTKSLLSELIPLNKSFRHPIGFNTQITLNVAKDDEVLGLLADANFTTIFIGIETPNVESLIETNKPQNYKTDIVADVRKIQSYGVPVDAGMIVGFDHDDMSIFDIQLQFAQESCIPNPLFTVLYAGVGTKLWIRLHNEGRILNLSSGDEPADDTYGGSIRSNIIPKLMSRVELLYGYRDLMERVRGWGNFEARLKGMISGITREDTVGRRRLPWNQGGSQARKGLLREAVKFCLSFDRKALVPIIRLLFYTWRKAPYMLNTVVQLIGGQYQHAAHLPMSLKSIDEEIEWEKANGFDLRRHRTVLFIPESFDKPYMEIFPRLHERVYRSLIDKSRIHDALVEVTYDFLARWGATFEQFEEHHRTFMLEICDRTIANENNRVQDSTGGLLVMEDVPSELADLTPGQVVIQQNRLAIEVLQAVEQEMRREPSSVEMETPVAR